MSLVSVNCNCYFAGMYYIDASVQLTKSIPDKGSVFQVTKNGKAVPFPVRKDVALIKITSESPEIYDTWLAPGTDSFVVNATTIPAGFYKLIAVINE